MKKSYLELILFFFCLIIYSCSNDGSSPDNQLGQVSIEVIGIEKTNGTLFSISILDGSGNVIDTKAALGELPQSLNLPEGTYQIFIQSDLRRARNTDDVVYKAQSDLFDLAVNQSIIVTLELELEQHTGWLEVTNVPMEGRVNAMSFVIGNYIYVGGGTAFPNTRLTDWWRYSMEDNSWSRLQDFPGGPRWGSISFNIGNRGYLGFGLKTSLGERSSEFWEYNPNNDSWTRLEDFPGGPRGGVISFVIDNRCV